MTIIVHNLAWVDGYNIHLGSPHNPAITEIYFYIALHYRSDLGHGDYMEHTDYVLTDGGLKWYDVTNDLDTCSFIPLRVEEYTKNQLRESIREWVNDHGV